MAKKITAQVKLQIPAGKATPAPPVGTALGPQGVNIMEFCKAFNAKTSAKDQEGLIIADRESTPPLLRPPGKATPAPPVGTALGPQGVNIMEFCKAFNAKTSAKDQEGLIIPVVITIYSDRSFTFIPKTPPVPVLIKRAVNLAKGSAEPNKTKVGKITIKQVEEIAKIKMPDLNCFSIESGMNY